LVKATFHGHELLVEQIMLVDMPLKVNDFALQSLDKALVPADGLRLLESFCLQKLNLRGLVLEDLVLPLELCYDLHILRTEAFRQIL
jgi:hypothetical protein